MPTGIFSMARNSRNDLQQNFLSRLNKHFRSGLHLCLRHLCLGRNIKIQHIFYASLVGCFAWVRSRLCDHWRKCCCKPIIPLWRSHCIINHEIGFREEFTLAPEPFKALSLMRAVMQRGKDGNERRHVMPRSDVEEWNRVLSERRNDRLRVCRAYFSHLGKWNFLAKAQNRSCRFTLSATKWAEKWPGTALWLRFIGVCDLWVPSSDPHGQGHAPGSPPGRDG